MRNMKIWKKRDLDKMKLKVIQKKLIKSGITAEMIDVSLDSNTTKELWNQICSEIQQLKEWEQKRNTVMIAIISKRLERLSQRILDEKYGKVFRISMTTINPKGQKKEWKFRSVSDVLRLWWCGLIDEIPTADDYVLKLIVDSRIRMTDCCFKEVVGILEKEYWKG